MNTGTLSIPTDAQYTLLSVLFLTLCPLLSVPFILYAVYHRQRGAYAVLALLLGIMAFISAPSEDLYRHFCLYSRFSVRPLSAITWMDTSLNGILPYLYWLMARLGISFSYLRFFELTVGFYLLCRIFDEMIEQSTVPYTSQERMVRFAIFFLFFDFLYTTMGVKFGFALCTYLYSLHLIIVRHRTAAGLCFFLLTCMWHVSFVFTGPAVHAIYRYKPSRSTVAWACVVLAVVVPVIISIAGSYLFGRRFDFYFSKKADDVTSYAAMTLPGLMLYILPKLAVIPFALILLKRYTTDTPWCRIATGWFLLAVVMMSNAVTFYRFWWAFMATGPLLVLELERRRRFSQRTLMGLIASGLLFTAFNMTAYHKEVTYSPYYRALYPAPLVIATDFDKRWVFNNIAHDGDFK